MPDIYPSKEKREFFRYRLEKPIHYKVVEGDNGKKVSSGLKDAVSKNLSASGLLFNTNYIPQLSSILVLDLDYRTTQVCQEIEERALVWENKLLGKVVRIEDVDDGTYDIGVAFIKKSDNLPEDIKKIVG